MNPDLFQKSEICLYCQKKFKTMKVKTKAVRLLKQDTDFCPTYQGENPYYYTVNICPYCGMAFTEGFGPIRESVLSELRESYLNKVRGLNLCGPRTIQEAIKSFQLALLCAEIIQERDLIKANMCLAIAWLYRIKGDKEGEKTYLEKALNGFIYVYERDRAGSEELQKVLYLIGELYARQNQYEASAKWFNILFSQPVLEPAIETIARERWQEIRSQYKYSNK